MFKIGRKPYLECSSKGDKRFSAFIARIVKRDNKSIEELYQAAKVFADGSTGLSWQQAKGKQAVNQEECRILYSTLWDEYFEENKGLLLELSKGLYLGFSDMFGQEGHACQAAEIYRIVQHYRETVLYPEELKAINANMQKYGHLIVNLQHQKDVTDAIYCGRGRGSIWGNDYSHLDNTTAPFQVASREEAVIMHRRKLYRDIVNGKVKMQDLAALHNQKVSCWCMPALCHCSTLLAAAEWAKRQTKNG